MKEMKKIWKYEYDDLKCWLIDKNGDVVFKRIIEKLLLEKVKRFSVLHDKRVKGFKATVMQII